MRFRVINYLHHSLFDFFVWIMSPFQPSCRLLFHDQCIGLSLINEVDVLEVKAPAIRDQTTQLFWPFSSPPSLKTVAIGDKSSKSHSVHSVASSSAESVERVDNTKLVSKAIREAQDVMRRLVLKDKEAARKAAEDNVSGLQNNML
jgi:hypothetical protein